MVAKNEIKIRTIEMGVVLDPETAVSSSAFDEDAALYTLGDVETLGDVDTLGDGDVSTNRISGKVTAIVSKSTPFSL